MRGGGSSQSSGSGKSSPVPRSTRQSLQVSQKQDTSCSYSTMPALAIEIDSEVSRDSERDPEPMDKDTHGNISGEVSGRARKETGTSDDSIEFGSSTPSTTKRRSRSPEPDVTETRESDLVAEENHFPWTNKLETIFFKCLMRHKPLGIHKNFQMLLAAHEFKTAAGKEDIDIDYLWKHLSDMYCIEELEDIERENALPIEEMDFELPDKEFGELIRNFIEAKDGKVKEVVKAKDPRPLSPPIAVTSAGVKRTIAKSAKLLGRKSVGKSGGGKQSQAL